MEINKHVWYEGSDKPCFCVSCKILFDNYVQGEGTEECWRTNTKEGNLLVEYQRSYRDQGEEIRELKEDIARLILVKDKAVRYNEEDRVTINRLETKAVLYKEEIIELREEVAKWKKVSEDDNVVLRDMAAKIEGLKAGIDVKVNLLGEAVLELSELRPLGADIEGLKADITYWIEEGNIMRVKLTERVEEVEGLKGQREADAEYIKILKVEISDLVNENTRLKFEDRVRTGKKDG